MNACLRRKNIAGSGAACVHAVSVSGLESLGQQACLLCLEKMGNQQMAEQRGEKNARKSDS